jgi:hypothetical protein
MHRFVSFLLFLPVALAVSLLGACGSSAPPRPASIPRPELYAELSDRPFFGTSDRAAVNVLVTVRNRAAVPITIRRAEVDSPGMTQYTLRRAIRDFHETVGPGEEKTVTVFTTAYTTTQRPTEPLTIRALVTFEAGGERWREILLMH